MGYTIQWDPVSKLIGVNISSQSDTILLDEEWRVTVGKLVLMIRTTRLKWNAKRTVGNVVLFLLPFPNMCKSLFQKIIKQRRYIFRC